MSASNPQKEVKLKVSVEEPGTEIFLLDDQSRVLLRKLDTLETSQPRGVYKIKLRAGLVHQDEILFLDDKPIEKYYTGLPFDSPIPLAGTAGARESHVKAAELMSRELTRIVAGEGSEIFFFIRDYPCAGEPGIHSVENPGNGFTVKTSSGRIVADLATQSETASGAEPWSACALQLTPGPYVLSYKAPGAETCERTIYAAEGWHTQVFIKHRLSSLSSTAEHPVKIADLDDAAVLVTKSKEFWSGDSNSRLVELARLTLSSRRRILAGNLRAMLDEKFEHPMLGVYGAHLLLMEPELDVALFKTVIGNLRLIFGNDHPDVEALSLAINQDDTKYIFNTPPMLRCSWSLVVRATERRPELVPLGSLAEQVAECVLGSDPWLTWIPAATRIRKVPGFDFESVLKLLIVPYYSSSLVLPALIGEVLQQKPGLIGQVVRTAVAVVAGALQRVAGKGFDLEHSLQAQSSELKLTPEQTATLVEHLQIPRYNVERLVYKNAPTIQKELQQATEEVQKFKAKAAS